VRETRARLDKTSLDGGDSSLVGSGMLALAPPRVRIVVDSRVSVERVSHGPRNNATG
jgi:hypothetical protein